MPPDTFSRDGVSIIIPTFNRPALVPQAIRSALAQTHPRLEVVVVDNGSTDNTQEILRSFTDPRLHCHRLPVNGGTFAAWEAGLQLARGAFIVFLADDDQLRPEFVANRWRRMAGNSEVMVAFSAFETHDCAGARVSLHHQERTSEERYSPTQLLVAAFWEWFSGTSMYRKSAVDSVWPLLSPQISSLIPDLPLNLFLALSGAGVGVFLPVNDFIYLAHLEQASQARKMQVFAAKAAALEWFLARPLTGEQAAILREELAHWHVLWGRQLAGQGLIQDARRHFLKAIKVRPTLPGGWTQLVKWSLPSRLRW